MGEIDYCFCGHSEEDHEDLMDACSECDCKEFDWDMECDSDDDEVDEFLSDSDDDAEEEEE